MNLEETKKLLVAGEWVPAADGGVAQTYDPADGQLLASFAEAGPADVDAALVTATPALAAAPKDPVVAVKKQFVAG
ncbi:hypothetical protein ACWEPC_33665, partial [Nonomuraea sp. NPDC004297]